MATNLYSVEQARGSALCAAVGRVKEHVSEALNFVSGLMQDLRLQGAPHWAL